MGADPVSSDRSGRHIPLHLMSALNTWNRISAPSGTAEKSGFIRDAGEMDRKKNEYPAYSDTGLLIVVVNFDLNV